MGSRDSAKGCAVMSKAVKTLRSMLYHRTVKSYGAEECKSRSLTFSENGAARIHNLFHDTVGVYRGHATREPC